MSKIESLALSAPWARGADAIPLQGVRAGLRGWLLRSPDPQSLRELDRRQRRDIGLESDDAWGRESAEPFWRG